MFKITRVGDQIPTLIPHFGYTILCVGLKLCKKHDFKSKILIVLIFYCKNSVMNKKKVQNQNSISKYFNTSSISLSFYVMKVRCRRNVIVKMQRVSKIQSSSYRPEKAGKLTKRLHKQLHFAVFPPEGRVFFTCAQPYRRKKNRGWNSGFGFGFGFGSGSGSGSGSGKLPYTI